MFEPFANIVGLQGDRNRVVEKGIWITNVIARIRDVLGVPQLVEIRARLLEIQNAEHASTTQYS
jgi:hypothetical protein